MRFLPLLATLFICPSLFAQEPDQNTYASQIWEAGLPFVTNYTPEDYKAHVQNWCFIQNDNGIIYVGNTSGILEFDGVSWRLIALPNGSPAKSFAKSNNETIYVGAVRDFGYLYPDSVGVMQFQSLVPQLDTVYHNFADIWFTYAVGDAAYFISDDYMFKWHKNKFKVWKAENGFGFAGLVRDQIYIDQKGVGLMRLQNDSLVLISDGDKFLGKKGGITAFIPYKENKILMGHVLEGLFLYDHEKLSPFTKNGQNLLYEKYLYGGTILPNGDFALFTPGNGCFILDAKGNIKQWLSKKRGLTSDVILGIYVDHEGSLWLATEKGINKVEISSPLRVFGQQSGLSEGAHRIVYNNHRLYVATLNGIFYLKNISTDLEKTNFQFQNIDGIDHQTWDVITKGKFILAGNFKGLYQIDATHHVKQLTTENTSDLCPSSIDTNRVYAGTMYGNLHIVEFVNRQWQEEKPALSLQGRIIKIEEDSDGSLWIGTRYNGIYKLDWSVSNLNRTFNDNYTLTHYDTLNGLPEISYNAPFNANGKIYFSTQAGIFRFDTESKRFKPDRKLMEQINITNTASGLQNWIQESALGGMWISIGSNVDNSIYKYEEGVAKEVTASKRFSDFGVYDIFELNDIVFFSGIKGSIGYNQQINRGHEAAFPVNVRRVLTKNDSLLFGGHFNKQSSTNEIFLSFNSNSLRFIYALPSFDKPEANQYQYFLEGFDGGWSTWSTETQRDFTNLPEGDYLFRVRGKNVYGQMSDEAVYAFTILPPLHRTWWAFLIYVLAGAGIVVLIVRWRSNQLRKEKEELEIIVADRTHQLEEQAEKLKELDQQKSRFFANISHEFRTPLTLIKGPAENALQSQEGAISKNDTLLIRNNANRLLRLVNQLLDLSKLDANKLSLSPTDGNICRFLRAVGSAFRSHAEQSNIEYLVDIPEEDVYISFDHDKLEKILYNLLSNAFKFSADKGKVTFKADCKNNKLTLLVSDNGIGIPRKQLPFIFDRFYQTDDSHAREYEGAGIGLALSKELITLMNGTIDVKSDLDSGTKFFVTIPMVGISRSDNDKVEEKHIQSLPTEAEKSFLKNIDDVNEEVEIDAPIILIVEDNTDMRDFIRKQLVDEYKIQEAANGKSGLAKAQNEIPDLIITDLMMPEMDGIELCQKLKTDERTSHIPVIMLTAKAGQEQKIEGLETGADDYLTKPFDKEELQVRIKNLIRQRKQLRERFSKEVVLEPKKISITSMDEQFLNKVIGLLEGNLPDEKFGVPKLQGALAMSKTQLHRKMKALTDQAPGEFIRHYRLQRAAQILSEQGGNVTEVAFAVGFGSLSYFTRSFKEYYQKSPSEYAAQKSK